MFGSLEPILAVPVMSQSQYFVFRTSVKEGPKLTYAEFDSLR